MLPGYASRRSDANKSGSSPTSEIVLQNARVLAIDQSADERQTKAAVAKSAPLDFVTMEAQYFHPAAPVGTLSLLLLKPANWWSADSPAPPRDLAGNLFGDDGDTATITVTRASVKQDYKVPVENRADDRRAKPAVSELKRQTKKKQGISWAIWQGKPDPCAGNGCVSPRFCSLCSEWCSPLATVARQSRPDIQISGSERTTSITVTLGKSRDLRTGAPFTEVSVGDPDVADVNPLTDRSISILGKKIGTTRVAVYGIGKRLVGLFDVEVTST